MVVTRFPPSPTGHLHLGGARTALFNWLFARHNKGKFILRFEDTDRERSKPEYVDSIISALKWLGLEWDEGPYFQSERIEIYQKYAKKLFEEGKAYYCECSKEVLEKKKEEMLKRGLKPRYDGTCRDKNLGPGEGRALRIKVPEIEEIIFEDLLRGKIVFPAEEIDDFIIMRSDGTPTYHFAVVIDDITMGITHVIRGDDHISNTPKQIIIYNALGVNPPEFAHIPMVLGSDGARLSKRHGAKSVLEYKEAGFLPKALINYLARLGWGYGDQEYFTVEELIEKFDLQSVNLSPARFDQDKLLAINAYWIKNSDNKYLLEHLKYFLKSYDLDKFSEEYLLSAIETVKTRSKTLVEMAEMIEFYLVEEVSYDLDGAKKFLVSEIKPLLQKIVEDLEEIPLENEKKFEEYFRELSEKSGIKLKNIAQAVRVALTGKAVSPSLFEIMKVLGKERVEKRLKRALDFIESQR
ncbi:glutamyl-tRNA synthetase [Thermodesulfobacterium geofontis OPF15]|uniref:Glutamate--tRNA ligase n=1 Tax=Thermodesulfobacterium geofontis (strain OPF15) TaxID=795359 RepID=F8C4R8_THEGP|nr:glutamate--tRNA ligase [Thermodesulfobacterium geofontis]AEH23173.1 glutamyl-tRNA synthetase [Thermodesulfobacterium geofontis OPF15]